MIAPCILALDPGHALGYCVDGDSPRSPRSGVCQLPRNYPDYGKTWCFLEAWLREMVKQFGVKVLAWEAPLVFGGARGSTKATNSSAIEFAFGVGSVCELVGARLDLICWKVALGTARLHFTGNGSASSAAKGRVYESCLARGYPVTSHDAADATAIWDFVAHCYRRGDLVAGPLFADPAKVRSLRRPAPSLAEEVDAAHTDD